MVMHSVNVEEAALLMRWVQLPIFTSHVALVSFVFTYLHSGRLLLAWISCGLRMLALILNFTSEQNLFFIEVTGLAQVTVFGDEMISVPYGILNPNYIIGPLSMMALAVFMLDATIATRRHGTETDLFRAKIVAASIVFILFLAPVNLVLLHAGKVYTLYFVGFAFIPMLVGMSYLLGLDVLRASQLSQQLKLKEAALYENNQRMDLAMSAADLSLWEWDIIRDEMWRTDKSRGKFVADSEKIHFEDFLHRLHPDDQESVRHAAKKALASGSDYESEYRQIMPDGSTLWFAGYGRIEYQGKIPVRMRGVTLNVTRRKQAELRIQQKSQKLAHLSRVMQLGEMSGALAHELQQPLAAILGNARAAQHLLEHGRTNIREVREIINDIITDNKHASGIIHHLRQFFKNREIKHETLNLQEVVKEVLILTNSDLLTHRVSVVVLLPAELPLVIGDRVHIQQVLLNLLHNGCEAMADIENADERRLSIFAKDIGGHVQISIADQGHGIPSEHIDSIFEPFFTSKSQGMGLGLNICRNIIHAHGGQIWIDNNGERGTVFHFTLPVCIHE